jgi:hypothetical protein
MKHVTIPCLSVLLAIIVLTGLDWTSVETQSIDLWSVPATREIFSGDPIMPFPPPPPGISSSISQKA